MVAFFFGLKAAVLAIVLQAVHRVGSRALKSQAMLVLAALAFLGIFFLGVPFPLIGCKGRVAANIDQDRRRGCSNRPVQV